MDWWVSRIVNVPTFPYSDDLVARAKSRQPSKTCYRGYQTFERQKRTKKTNVWVKLHHIALLCGVLSSRPEVGSTARTEIQAALKAWFRAAESVKICFPQGGGKIMR